MGRTIFIFLQFKDTLDAVPNAKSRNGPWGVCPLQRTYDANGNNSRVCPVLIIYSVVVALGEVEKTWNGRRKNARETCSGKNIGKTPIPHA